MTIVAGAFLASAWAGRTPPFEERSYDPYSETSILRAIPFDAPLPYDMALVAAGRGDELAYHVQWSSAEPSSGIAEQFREHLAGSPRWVLTQEAPTGDNFTTTMARLDSRGYMTHFARLAISPSTGQTFITLDFTPVPSSLAPD